MMVGAPTEYDLEAKAAGAYEMLGAAQLAEPLKAKALPESGTSFPQPIKFEFKFPEPFFKAQSIFFTQLKTNKSCRL